MIDVLAAGGALMMGVAGGAHCATMCGPLSAALCSKGGLGVGLRVHAGRLATYSLLGALVGAAGSALSSAVSFELAGTVARVGAALVLLWVGAGLMGLRTQSARASKGSALRLLSRLPAYKALDAVRGLVWGLLPCGLVVAALALAAATRSAGAGAVSMLLFGVGTLPTFGVMALVLGRLRKGSVPPRLRQTAGLVLMLSGAIQLSLLGVQRGLVELPVEERPCCAGPERSAETP